MLGIKSLETLKDSINEVANKQGEEALSEFIKTSKPSIAEALKNKGVILSKTLLENEAVISQIANIIHQMLPNALKLLLSEEKVKSFLLANRQKLTSLIEKLV